MSDSFTLAGRSALVTGAGGGIGAAVATAYAAAGAVVLVTDRDKDAAAAVADRIVAAGGRAQAAALDVTNADQATTAVEQAADSGHPGIAILADECLPNLPGIGLRQVAGIG